MAEHSDNDGRGKVRQIIVAGTLILVAIGVLSPALSSQEPADATTSTVLAGGGGGGNTGNIVKDE